MMQSIKNDRHTAFAKRILLAAAICMLPAAHPGAHVQQTKVPQAKAAATAAAATPVATVMAFHAALTRSNTAGALALLAEDALIFESGGVERGRAEYASHHLAADAAFSAAVTRKLIDRQSGEEGNMAWVMSTETVVGTYRGRAINSRSVETMLLRRADGRWSITHIHWSSATLAAK